MKQTFLLCFVLLMNSFLVSSKDNRAASLVMKPDTYSITENKSLIANSNTASLKGSIPSNVITPTMLKIKPIGSASVCDPNTVSFVVDPNASSLNGFTFQWNNNGLPIAGATDTSLLLSGVGSGAISLTLTGTGSTINSSSKPYLIKETPSAMFMANGNTNICIGSSVTLNAPNVSGYSYSWLMNGTIVGSGNTKVAKQAGSYTVVAKLNNCTDTSSSLTVVVNQLPIVTISNLNPLAFCGGDSCVFSAAPSNAMSYQWYDYITPVATLTNTNQFTVYGSAKTKVVVTDSNGCVGKQSNVLKTMVTAYPPAGISPAGTFTIGANTTSFTLHAIPQMGVAFQWFKNGVAINGATIKHYKEDVIPGPSGFTATYTLMTSKNGCTTISTPTIVTRNAQNKTSFSNSSFSDADFELSAYPNPVNDVLTISLTSSEQVVSGNIEVINLLGQPIAIKAITSSENIQLSTASWTSGMYLIRFKDGQGNSATLKIEKQ
jgi:hypothetical protein